jgi:predicted permease
MPFLLDLRYALRLLRLRPGSSAAIVLTLALAIGANGTLFTLVNAALFSPLPVERADRLVNIYTTTPNGTGYGALSYPDYADLAQSGGALADTFGYSGLMATLTGEGSSEVVFGELVTANYFSALGVRPAVGRGFLPVEGQERGAHPVVVISDRLWKRVFASDPGVAGRTLPLNGRLFTIVGVAPEGFGGLLFRAIAVDVWAPASMMAALRTDQLDNRDERWMFVKARLRDGTTADQAAAQAQAVATNLASTHPSSNRSRTFRVVPTTDVIVNPDGDRGVLAASGAVLFAAGLVLVVACANLSGVMLARGLARRREIAVRLAIGARRIDVVRQLLIESALLSVVGGALGLALARSLAGALAAWRPDLPVPVSLNTTIDVRVVLFTAVLTLISMTAFAVLPALRASRLPVASAAAGFTAPGGRKRRRLFGLRDAVIVPQLAIAIALIAVAGLFVRSVARAGAVSPGFDTGRTAFIALNLGMSGYDEARAQRFYADLGQRLVEQNIATAAAGTTRLPLDLYGSQSTGIVLDDGVERSVQTGRVGADFFSALGVLIVRGRAFDRRDGSSGDSVAIVSAAAARQFWPDADPVGRVLRVGDAPATVIGVAADVKVQTLGEGPQPFVYRPLASGHAGLMRLVVRTAGDPDRVVEQMRQAVREMDPAVAVFEARSMAHYVDVMLYPYRLAATIGSAFGILALALAGVGIYGVIACGVGERLREVAIRLALGAGAAALMKATLGETIRAAAVGVAAGAMLAFVAGQLLADVLFGISPMDPVTLLWTAGLLVAVLVAAAAGPVRRALGVDPMSLLRQ